MGLHVGVYVIGKWGASVEVGRRLFYFYLFLFFMLLLFFSLSCNLGLHQLLGVSSALAGNSCDDSCKTAKEEVCCAGRSSGGTGDATPSRPTSVLKSVARTILSFFS